MISLLSISMYQMKGLFELRYKGATILIIEGQHTIEDKI